MSADPAVQRKIEGWFPGLAGRPWAKTSEWQGEYNCIAYAAGDKKRIWWPFEDVDDGHGDGCFWPEAVDRRPTLAAFVAAFRTLGYVQVSLSDLDPGVEKVALFALDGVPKHAAIQLESGRWSSKLGQAWDIEHDLVDLQGPRYGQVAAILARSREQHR